MQDEEVVILHYDQYFVVVYEQMPKDWEQTYKMWRE